MIYISEDEQQAIQKKIKNLPPWLNSRSLTIVFFEALGTLVLTYGICVSLYIHPIQARIKNPAFNFLISCFFYFALSIAAPFSGAHMNPAVTLSFSQLKKNDHLKSYLLGQAIGAAIGGSLAYGFFGVIAQPCTTNQSFGDSLLDTVGQIFGTFIFTFFMIYVSQTNYMAGEYFRYLVISIMLLAGRIFTLRKGVINPIVGLVFQVITAIEKGNFLLFIPYSLPYIIGPLIGGYLSAIFFNKFYLPLREQLQDQKEKQLEQMEQKSSQ